MLFNRYINFYYFFLINFYYYMCHLYTLKNISECLYREYFKILCCVANASRRI